MDPAALVMITLVESIESGEHLLPLQMKKLRAKFQTHFNEAVIVKMVSKLWKERQATDTITVWLTTRGIINPAHGFGGVGCSVQPQLHEGKCEHALSFPGK